MIVDMTLVILKNNIKMNHIKILFILICIISSEMIYAQSNNETILSAGMINEKNQIDWFINQIKQEIVINKSRNLGLKYYNLAICYSAKKQIDSTCSYLIKCINYSPDYNKMILTDTDFDFLQKKTCWKEIVNHIDSIYLTLNPKITNKQFAIELYHIVLKDQQARGLGMKSANNKLINTDKENLQKVEELIYKYGWPTFSMVGKTSANGAFLVIQHSNIMVQQKYLKQIVDAAQKGEASMESVALLIDRISVRLKGIQIFGTQVYQVKDSISGKLGRYKYFPIKDEEIVDSLRKECGLIPIKKYYALFGINYNFDSK